MIKLIFSKVRCLPTYSEISSCEQIAGAQSRGQIFMKWSLYFFAAALILNGSLVRAAQPVTEDLSKNPLGCRDLGYEYKLNVLKIITHTGEANQSLFFVYNRLNKPINLFQMLPENSTRSTYLNHTIAPQQWSVLATNQNVLDYVCTVDDAKSAYGKIVSCADSVKVCEYARVKFGLNNRGNYWIVGSNNRGGAVNDVIRYGIIPR